MSDARLPRQFGKYTLLRPLARGGMGELYLATIGDLGGAEKLCVIKKLPEAEPVPKNAPPGAPRPEPLHTRRLLDEARVMVRLNHVNLVQVFDAGVVEGELYLAMELVAGRDLRAAWNRCADLRARIPVDMALYVVREVARGLAYAHGYGGLALVHRDIAPPNILLSWQGEVKITDFGLAASRLKSERTGPGIVFGRIGYLSPEQARGEKADRRTDMILVGGSNVYPAEIEAALEEHPDVQSCAVIGLPDDDLGSRVHAIVHTHGARDEAALRSHLSTRLVTYKQPRSYEFTDEALRDDAGKVRRTALRDARIGALKQSS